MTNNKTIQLKFKLIGDIWRASIEVARSVFLYKYVLVDHNDTIVKWEEGYNRLADLEIAYTQGLCTDNEYIFRDVGIFYQFLQFFTN